MEHNTVICPEFGLTTRKVRRTPPAEWASQLWIAAGVLGRKRRLLGFSLGASWSLRLLPLAPQALDAAVFVAGYPTPGASGQQQQEEGLRLRSCRARQLWLHSTSDSLCPWQSGSCFLCSQLGYNTHSVFSSMEWLRSLRGGRALQHNCTVQCNFLFSALYNTDCIALGWLGGVAGCLACLAGSPARKLAGWLTGWLGCLPGCLASCIVVSADSRRDKANMAFCVVQHIISSLHVVQCRPHNICVVSPTRGYNTALCASPVCTSAQGRGNWGR